LVHAALAIAGFLIVLSLFGFYQAIRPTRILSDLMPGDLSLPFESVQFRTSDGIMLRGWLIPSREATRKTVILLHGYPADKGDVLPSHAFLHERYNLLLFDFRSLGQSEGRYSTAGAREVEDLLAAMEFLKSRGLEQVGVWGFSMGGAVALMAVGRAANIKAVVAEASYSSLDAMARNLFPVPILRYPLAFLTGIWAKLFLGIDLRDVSPLRMVRQASIPILLIHSPADPVVPFSHALTLQEALKHNRHAEFWFPAGLTHGALAPEYQQRIKNFFARNL
jgi:dipeptidyl aminopeptidase/acylaminoacyl peptidase